MVGFLLSMMVIQVILFNVDEYYFHRKRGLVKQEVISAIVDGALYLIPLLIAIFLPFNSLWQKLYIGFAMISCLSIAKNECFYPSLTAPERVVHALLYILHPVMLYTFYISWEQNYFTTMINFWMIQIIYMALGAKTLTYQIIYWNYVHQKPEAETAK